MVGRILTGDEAGCFVEVVDDTDSSGGFLVQTYEHSDRSGVAYDSWVESVLDVDTYFDERAWDVDWPL